MYGFAPFYFCMVEFEQIYNGDPGYAAREKLNRMLFALITGEEGINKVWEWLRAFEAVTTDSIEDGAITTPKIANGAVEEQKIGTNAISVRTLGEDVLTMIAAIQAAGIALAGTLGDSEVIGIHQKTLTAYITSLQEQITRLREQGFDDYYTKEEVDTKLQAKVDSEDTYTKVETDGAIAVETQRAQDAENALSGRIEILESNIVDEMGDSSEVGISQRCVTDAINHLWAKISEITGEALRGISMTVTPQYYIGEEGCNVHITASADSTCGIFETIKFQKHDDYDSGWVDIIPEGEEFATMHNRDYVSFDFFIERDTTFKCTTKILGQMYEQQKTVANRSSFWLGVGTSYQGLMIDDNLISFGHNAYDRTAVAGDHIIVIVGKELAESFVRADINGVEIPFTQQEVTIGDNDFVVFTSENTYIAGTYNIDING
mgnify:CR=1 FL=1